MPVIKSLARNTSAALDTNRAQSRYVGRQSMLKICMIVMMENKIQSKMYVCKYIHPVVYYLPEHMVHTLHLYANVVLLSYLLPTNKYGCIYPIAVHPK